jgi:SAM-dependent methyltransferase
MTRLQKRKTSDVGRPSLPSDKRKVRVSLSISPSLLRDIDSVRGYRSRSEYVETFLKEPGVTYNTEERRERNSNGSVYTPASLAKYVGQKVATLFVSSLVKRGASGNVSLNARKWRIIDPACGDGELLSSVWEGLLSKCKAQFGVDHSSMRRVKASDMLCGIDIDTKALRRAKRRLCEIANVTNGTRTKLLATNALFPFNSGEPRTGWERIKQSFDAADGFDVVIANPPWGANVAAYRHLLDGGYYDMYKGQFDTADLFFELALNICKPGGYIAFIVPDSLFSQEREKLRTVLLERTRLRLVARLGEKVFDQVNRACAVVVCEKSRPHPKTRTVCVRLTPEIRKRVLSGSMSFADAEKRLAHSVPQSRFMLNGGNQLNIDVTMSEERTLGKLLKSGTTFRSILTNARGVELSKHGRVIKCVVCEYWQPRPNTEQTNCRHCRAPIDLLNSTVESVVTAEKVDGYVPFIVGECIQRYVLGPCLWIDPGKEGLNYKALETYDPPKLLVRKTGVGISATIDYTTAYTNQVVYIFHLKVAALANVTLETCLGILNSRLMYYYLVKMHGETEWRSHPYITQQQILDLPVPFGGKRGVVSKSDCVGIHKAVKTCCTRNTGIPLDADARIERHVANLFGLSRVDYETIYATLDNVQSLLPVRALKSVPLKAIFSRQEA